MYKEEVCDFWDGLNFYAQMPSAETSTAAEQQTAAITATMATQDPVEIRETTTSSVQETTSSSESHSYNLQLLAAGFAVFELMRLTRFHNLT